MIITTEKVWEEFHPKLKQFILKRIPDEQSAEDILQEVFLKIHTRINTLRDEEKLQSWIYQIARNAIADYYRAHKATVGAQFIAPNSETLLLPEEPIVNDDVVKELIPSIKAMVDSLPADYRQALILTEYEGLTQRELAARLGLSFSGAKSRVQRAREKLKTMLLDCCHFEFDRLGKVIDYQPKCACCANNNCASGCK
ncbi:MAG TPA: RNA polymerase sigma factor SigZ [Ktedonobacteraceae bacterium]|nr:RNA polymerase sigma factor SigZ [Ktedonobacteraceae bacterium]